MERFGAEIANQLEAFPRRNVYQDNVRAKPPDLFASIRTACGGAKDCELWVCREAFGEPVAINSYVGHDEHTGSVRTCR